MYDVDLYFNKISKILLYFINAKLEIIFIYNLATS